MSATTDRWKQRQSMPCDYLLFDLGQVLVRLRSFDFLKRFKPGWSETRIARWWGGLECMRLFETGRIDEPTFLQRAVDETAFAGTIAEFRRLFAGWVVGVYPGAEDLVDRLRTQVRIGVLSNTNSLHIQLLGRRTGLLDAFHDRFYSFEMGLLKPDKRIYAQVLARTGVPAARMMFFDDNRTNIAAAAAMGIQAIRVSDFDDLLRKLDRWQLGKTANDEERG